MEKPYSFRLGTKFVSPKGEVYILALTSKSTCSLINHKTGNLWSFEVALVNFNNFVNATSIFTIMNDCDTAYKTKDLWKVYEEDKTYAVSSKPIAADIVFPSKKAGNKKPDLIEVVRYYRPLNDNGNIDSSRGITAIFTIDYVNNVFKATWSMCNGDNFDKQLGKALANENASKMIYGRFYKNANLFANLMRALDDFSEHPLKNMMKEIEEARAISEFL